MAYCDVCGNFDDFLSFENKDKNFPKVDCMCEICFDIANEEKKIKWECASI